jgi:DGQHR domain-containing protein
MREIAKNIRYAEEIRGESQLSQAIQRNLNKARATSEIARYLSRHEDRFFGAIVVAALGGEPQWHPVSLEEDPQFSILGNRLTDAFGVLTFDGTENYYALDGQHRLAAIRHLLDKETDYIPPEGFHDEEVSVLVVTPRQLEREEDFIVRYRRLFGHLNRYAKAMSQYDNIIMDEDDALAIVTRRLVSQHPYFRSHSESQFENARVRMQPGKNVTAGSSHFTTLETLYDINVRLLHTRARRNSGWGEGSESIIVFKKFRPSEETIDRLEAELTTCWDALLNALPVLHEDPSRMRDHRPVQDREDPEESQDCVLFWPIVQLMLADLVRHLLDDRSARLPGDEAETQTLSIMQAQDAVSPLGKLVWDAHSPPWKHVLLVQSSEDGTAWRIASEGRKLRLRVVERIIRWQLGIDRLSDEEISGKDGLRDIWYSSLPAKAAEDPNEINDMWDFIENGVLP